MENGFHNNNKPTENHSTQLSMEELEKRLLNYKKEKEILLDLSNDITKVKVKSDLIKLFSSRLKSYFYFTHAVVSLIDHSQNSYYAFLIDTDSLPIKHREELPKLLHTRFPIKDPFIDQTNYSDLPVSFLLDDIIDAPGVPDFIKINYQCGIKQAMVAKLKHQMEDIGYVFIYSDRKDSFSDAFESVIHGITPHLSNAVLNIISNDQIRYKEEVNKILLSLSNDMVTVRKRTDLLNVINFGLKKLIYFTHSVMTEIDENLMNYRAFLVDPESRIIPFRAHGEAINLVYPVEDDIYGKALSMDEPVVFDMTSFDLNKVPLWFKLNYESGAREFMLAILPTGESSKRSIILFSDKLNSFDARAKEIIVRISSQLSTAASNIAANEEVLNKEKDNRFLLEFSNSIASAKTKSDLNILIHQALKKLGDISTYFIRIINEDGTTMSPFMYANDVFYVNKSEFQDLLQQKIPVNSGITAKVLAQSDPVYIDFQEEISNGNSGFYIEFWKKLGRKKKAFQKITGVPLRVGNQKLGIIWIITDSIKANILAGICAQISIAVSNIISYEEILQREEEKSKLLSLSDEIAALRSREDFLKVVSGKLKTLFSIDEYGIAQINEDGLTYGSFIIDVQEEMQKNQSYKEVTTTKYKISDPLFSRIMQSVEPIVIDVDAFSKIPGIPEYVLFWKEAGVKYVLGGALRVGGGNIGCTFLHINNWDVKKVKIKLFKAICSQISVAVSNIMANEQLIDYKQMLEVENDHLKEQIKTLYNFSDIIGSGPGMEKVYEMISLVADSNSTVLLLGETGTGKELIARAIHNASSRRDRLMIKVNCAALASNLIESELFGHEKGSFTGAFERRIGKFELANNSTLFLDEIGEMPIETQVKLLRVIQERELERVGGSATVKVNVRIIAATNRNLQEEVKAGRFRLDLYYRLNVFPIILPPLRERLEDIEDLARFFLARYSKNTGKVVNAIAPGVLRQLKSYLWPGNVRELEHLIERSVLLTRGNVLKEVQLPIGKGEELEHELLANQTLDQMERSYIITILKRCSGKIAGGGGASEILNVPSTTLHSKMKKLGIKKTDYFPA